MEMVTISRQVGKTDQILARHSTDGCRSSYGQAIWHVLEPDVTPGKAVWRQGTRIEPLTVLGVVGGWLVARQRDGLLCGILWSGDGCYYANLIETRRDGQPVRAISMKSLRSGRYRVRGAVAAPAFDDDSPLGCVLM
jgi:hypothetical protein